MKIRLDQIPDTGLKLSESYDPASLDLNSQDIKLTAPIVVSAEITKGINNISVKLTIDTKLEFNCGRCLDEFSIPLSKVSTINLATYGKDEIDLTGNLREEIILAYPSKSLCRDDCCGLCQACGQNLNQGKCNCKKASGSMSRRLGEE